MLNPHQSFKDWLNSINQTNLQDIAFLLCTSPYFSEAREIVYKPEKMLEKFLEVVDRYSQPSNESVDFLVTFKALFDFHFKSRSTEEGWNTVENRHKRMLGDSDLTPDMKDHLLKMISDLPERKKVWIDLCEHWETLKQYDLSDNSLRDWQQSRFYESLE
ncbi:hypothetical protein B9T23_01750 [Acinetobacter terrae]|uniref:hypothetical protein n=1 Tax=Acinetobacter terrae TaxID=2731247 RepID=UPI000A32D8A4|nr:hypothetical protein [Acinetobacter terrae]OTG78819.1 hypothetical protein B9T23_01750 [Acinetobacter terrae]